ncbi:unnamed protein product [Adineta steineri]|uniref:Uncharacterized protein n=1 Tax=Adineta steineri TaxID=433720 RepID=A0A814M156_9BILA|nr:unnamed protein product [Adineta steineri]CAF3660752.1 unnamed protein product [Adineta steineri]
MASSSNNSSTTSGLTNSYFFYGTHPLKVPNNVTHSNSTHNISSTLEQNTHHLSLHLPANHNGFSSTTKSLNNLLQTQKDNDDTEVFEDALESLDDDYRTPPVNEKHTSSKQGEESTIDLFQALKECEQITQLFFQNHLNEALRKTKEQENRSLYHSLSHSTISFLQAGMTFNQDDIEAAVQALKHTNSMAKKYEPNKSWIPFSLSSKPVLNEYELHAKLVYAEALLIGALLTFIQDQGLFSFISGALKIKECHDIFIKLSKQNDPSKFSSTLSYEHFDSGVRMGNGAFNLMISNLPQRIIRYLEFVGFSGDRELGLTELDKSANSKGLRATFSALTLLSYHTFVTPIFGNSDGDLEMCHTLVERFLKQYPNVSIILIKILEI